MSPNKAQQHTFKQKQTMQKIRPLKTLMLGLFLSFGLGLAAQAPVSYEPAFPNLDFRFPVALVSPDDNTNRFFVLEQSGIIRVFENNKSTQASTVFLDVQQITRFSQGQEMGLLGLAFHPDYKSNGQFYIYHTGTNPTNNRIDIILAQYSVSENDPNVANPNSRIELIRTTKNQNNSNHNGGAIGFGPDGYLYMSIGDGGGGGDPMGNAQNINNLFGAILRVDVDLNGNNPRSANNSYEIPLDNPLVGRAGLDEIYAWGIRNTWKFSWDIPTDRMWGGDVGQNQLEEINLIKNGGNYGWNRFEGDRIFNNNTTLVTSPDVKPVFVYDHSNNDVSITGGFVYRGANTNPRLQGKYIYADYVTGRVFALDYDAVTGSATSETLFRTNGVFVSTFALDNKGELFFCGYGTNAQIYQIVGDQSTDPEPVAIEGIGSWAEFQGGTNGIVEALERSGDNVYVAGEFTTIGGTAVSNVAMFNETTGWNTLRGGANGKVSALEVAPNGNLYVAGEFTTIGGIRANNIAMWDGTQWTALGTGVAGQVSKIEINKGEVYVGGTFENAGGIAVRNIAKWNGSWNALRDVNTGQAGTNNEIRSIEFDSQGILYIGGNFDEAGGQLAPRIAVFDGFNWGTLGAGTSGFVQAITATEDYIYAGGNFAIAGSTTVNRIARWNRSTSEWESLGGGLGGNVNDLLVLDGFIYAVGSFETATAASGLNYRVNNAARWSAATDWQALGTWTSVGTDNRLNAIVADDLGGFLAGGNFTTAGIQNASNLAEWNPESRIPDNGIAQGGIFEMEPQHDTALRLQVRGGQTNAMNGTLVDGIQRNGAVSQQWKFNQVAQNVYEIEPQNSIGKLLGVVGATNTTQNAPIDILDDLNQNNQRWRALPIPGTDLFRFEPLSAPGKRLDIETLGGVPRALSRNLDTGNSQRWRLIPVAPITSLDPLVSNAWLSVYPNPSQSGIFELDQSLNWKVYTTLGELVASGNGTIIDLSQKTHGVYVLKTALGTHKVVIK